MAETDAQLTSKMGLSELLNANLSKKMGLGMLGMYLVSETVDIHIALTIAGIALFGITAQTLIDWRKAREAATNDPPENIIGSSEPAPD